MSGNWKPTLPNLAYFTVGSVSTLAVLLLLFVHQASRLPSAKETRQESVRDSINWYRAESSFDCKDLRRSVTRLLTEELEPALSKRVAGTGWSQHISDVLRADMETTFRHFSTCARLYKSARDVGIHDLDEAAFSDDLENQMTILNVLVIFGEPKRCQDKTCLDDEFARLKETYDLILDRLAHVQD